MLQVVTTFSGRFYFQDPDKTQALPRCVSQELERTGVQGRPRRAGPLPCGLGVDPIFEATTATQDAGSNSRSSPFDRIRRPQRFTVSEVPASGFEQPDEFFVRSQ